MTDYLVFRHDPSIPEEARDPSLEGRWEEKPLADPLVTPEPVVGYVATARPTGFYETREDGVQAEIYLIELPTVLDEEAPPS